MQPILVRGQQNFNGVQLDFSKASSDTIINYSKIVLKSKVAEILKPLAVQIKNRYNKSIDILSIVTQISNNIELKNFARSFEKDSYGNSSQALIPILSNMIYNELLSVYIQLDLEYPEIEFTQVIKENEQNLDNISSVILSIVQKA